MTTDYRGKWVKKPWGRERILVETADKSVAVWHLHLDPGQSTSMHAHIKKKTARVVLGGKATVKFMSGEMNPRVCEKVRFAPGQYHQTIAAIKTACKTCGGPLGHNWVYTSTQDNLQTCRKCYDGLPVQYNMESLGHLDLLEVETPSDKQDLVRLEDQYGRAGRGYEGVEALEEDSSPILVEKHAIYNLGTCWLMHTLLGETGVEFFMPPLMGIVIFLSGGVRRGSMPVLSPGDVVEAETLRRLAAKYELLPSEVLEVSRGS